MQRLMSSVRATAVALGRQCSNRNLSPRSSFIVPARKATSHVSRSTQKKGVPPRDKAKCEIGPRASQSHGHHGSFFAGATGVGTGLAAAFWGASKEDDKSKTKEEKMIAIIREADIFYDAYLIDNAYNLLKRFENSKDSELLWRLARVICEKGKLAKDKQQRADFFHEAHRIGLRSLEFEPADGCFGAHKWFAVILNYVGEVEGTKAQITNSYHVRNHLERALEIHGDDPTTWHILGVWHFTFADMPSYQRLAAKAIFGTPPNSTYEQALEHFEKAEKISPGFYSRNTYYLAETLDRLGKKEEAREMYKKAFFFKVITADDLDVHTKAHAKLKKLGLSDKDLTENFGK